MFQHNIPAQFQLILIKTLIEVFHLMQWTPLLQYLLLVMLELKPLSVFDACQEQSMVWDLGITNPCQIEPNRTD